MVEKKYMSVKDLKVGKYIVIDGIPCRVVNIEVSRPGKHGHAKMKVTAIGIFEGQKKVAFLTGHDEVEVPVIERKTAQIISVTGDTAQLMDTQTYEVFEVSIPEELKDQVEPGKEAEVMSALGKMAIVKVK
ncbi:translation initiation factor IF-5A [Candidatus Micrarchaeota archaeon]|nr:translation initiation factor IF-5A [Candidatus Micrarchaeota archaeon]